MAQAWLRLADNYEARPVVQQQQQIQPKKGNSYPSGTPADPIFAAFVALNYLELYS